MNCPNCGTTLKPQKKTYLNSDEFSIYDEQQQKWFSIQPSDADSQKNKQLVALHHTATVLYIYVPETFSLTIAERLAKQLATPTQTIGLLKMNPHTLLWETKVKIDPN